MVVKINSLNIVFLIGLMFLISFSKLEAQNDSISKSKNSFWKQAAIPSILIGSSLVITNSDFEMHLQQDFGNSDFNTTIDDYTRFVPLAQMYAADIIGIESRSHWFDQTKNATISLLITDFVTTKLKMSIDKTRPSGANNNAFPSAHTAYAFTSATVLYEEFKNTSPILAYSGYAFAIATGYLRIAKDAHWFSDALLGAGIGIAITKLVYHFDYLFAWNPFRKKDNIMITPLYDGQGIGVVGVLKF
ncbi:phosphatase PAP2 family protein [Algibacter aquimarinus]|uniref:Phosphatase PAP2 family protein n=2 Tax=Algibacter aquimarinus TaxID=1136748 RepID=A0ABP9HMM4_9FLAO